MIKIMCCALGTLNEIIRRPAQRWMLDFNGRGAANRLSTLYSLAVGVSNLITGMLYHL